MKKLAALLLAGIMALGCVACGGTGNGGTASGNTEIKDATEVLTKVWTAYQADANEDVAFSAVGGNGEFMSEEGPGKYDLALEAEEGALVNSFCLPEDGVAKVDDAATMMHMMMANNFSAAAYHTSDAKAIVSGIKESVGSHRWMCGMPEKLLIVTIGDEYVVSAFGLESLIDTFKTAITSVYGDAAVISVEEAIVE